ncbi:MAG: Asp-tRNA(Asn)/Glu-tRNA(Gln) amidotransferase subunit GatA [Candidatus Geothermincolia bacterium]
MAFNMRSAWDLHRSLAAGECSAEEITLRVLERVRLVEERVKAYINLTADEALAAARSVDERRAAGEELPPAAGIPMAVKDVLCTRGVPTTCGSRMLRDYVPVYDATVVQRLRERGMIMIGKANMDEFAMGSSTENSHFGPTRNPWDLERVPGGSSGGSAAAVAAGEAVWSLGSDTGGSIRQPASFCGVVGLKPTYGLVSRYGLVAFASSLDQVGPVTNDVRDAAVLLNQIAGHDPCDSTSIPRAVPDYTEKLGEPVKGLRVGVPRELLEEGVTPGVKKSVNHALELLAGQGAEIEETSLSSLKFALSAYYVIAPAEASSNLARFDGVRYGFRSAGEDIWEMYGKTRAGGFGPEVKRRIMLGAYALSSGYYEAYYGQAQKIRTLIVRDFEQAFGRYDVLVSPTAPTPAFRIGEKVDDPLAMYLNDVCTIPVNLAGIPALSVPCGLDEGLPVGLQIIGRPLDESRLLQVGYACEQSLPPVGVPSLGGEA